MGSQIPEIKVRVKRKQPGALNPTGHAAASRPGFAVIAPSRTTASAVVTALRNRCSQQSEGIGRREIGDREVTQIGDCDTAEVAVEFQVIRAQTGEDGADSS